MSQARILDRFRFTPHSHRFEGKIFCIGLNKTGTTSIQKAFIDLGFAVGDQRTAELMLRTCNEGEFSALIEYCRGAQVFQDVPFSLPDVYKVLDLAFPGSKFILTVRDSPEVWYQSLVSFQSRLFGQGSPPTPEDLRNAEYVWKGWMWEVMCSQGLKDPAHALFDPEERMRLYQAHNQDVRSYFKDRPEDLLDINLKDPDAWDKFCRFIGIGVKSGGFPWENKTEDIPIGGWKNPVS